MKPDMADPGLGFGLGVGVIPVVPMLVSKPSGADKEVLSSRSVHDSRNKEWNRDCEWREVALIIDEAPEQGKPISIQPEAEN